jgi:ubiquinone/menaquinone biosynthesis C-methylase UbiE
LKPELKATQNFFDDYWKHEETRRLDSIRLFATSATSKAYSLMNGVTGKDILEIGPGEGFDLKALSSLGARVFGVDVSLRSLNLSKKTCPNAGFTGMDGDLLAFRDSTFDYVFCRTVLMHVEKQAFLRECRRVLKADGKAIFIEPLKYAVLVLPYRAVFSAGRFVKPGYLTPGEIVKMREVFSSVRPWFFYLASAVGAPFVSIAPWSRPLFAPLEWIDSRVLAAFPFLKSLCWISVIECVK